MKKPEKKFTIILDNSKGYHKGRHYGYNQACDDWEEYCDTLELKLTMEAEHSADLERELANLPSEEEIKLNLTKFVDKHDLLKATGLKYNVSKHIEYEAKAISKRIKEQK